MTKWIRTALALWIMTVCPFVIASEADAGLWYYAHRAWTPENSALRSIVRTITQTPDGYLWLGTDSGLVRFDGVRMIPWTPPHGQRLPGVIIQALLGARDGTLWIGTIGGLASWKDGQLTQYPVLSGFFVSALLDSRDGIVWAAGGWGNLTRKARLCAIRSGTATCYGDDGSLGTGIGSLCEDTGGGLWAATSTGLWHWKGGPPIRYAAGVFPTSIAQGENGSDLTMAVGRRVRQISDGKITDYPLPGTPSLLSARSVFRDRDGALWIGTDARGLVYAYRGSTRVFTHVDGLSSDQVFKIFEDHEGTIWVATSAGVDSFRKLPVATLSTMDGLSSESVSSVLAVRDGSVWIGTAAGLNRWKDRRMRVYRNQSHPGLPGDEIGTLFEDEQGRIWVHTSRGMAIFEAERFRAVSSVPPGSITAIANDHHGGLWLQFWANPNDYGLVHFVNGKVMEKVSWKDLGAEPGAGLVVDPDGGVWTGLLNGGLDYFRAGQIRKLQLSGSARESPRVFNISRGRDGVLWVAGEGGLARLAGGHVATLTTANGLPCNTVHWILEDDVSSYWAYTACGLLRIARSELDAWTADPKRKIQPTIFDSADGIRLVGILGPSRPHVTKSSDGRIWFQNGNRVSVIDPSRVSVNAFPPPVHIEQIAADGKTYDPEPVLRLPPLILNLTLDYTALSLVAPDKVHFKYKLEGQDRDWREVINEREVQYSNLAPGTYRFHVIACNNSGAWNQQGDTLEFSIAPAYYQTNWFRLLCAFGVLGLFWVAYRYRVRQVRQELTIGLEAKMSERTRIARDLHDTLLQSFHGLLLRFQAARNKLPGHPDEAIQALDDAIARTEQAVDEGRRSIQELRSGPFEENELDQTLIAIGQEQAPSDHSQDGSPTFKVIVEGERRDLAPLIREQILRIARELLKNAFQHAYARAIEAEIRYDSGAFRLIVRDDGKGIDPQILKDGGRPGHWGMPGVQERAREIGARLEFWSEAGAGTEVRLTVPAEVGYETPRNASRFRLFRKWRNP